MCTDKKICLTWDLIDRVGCNIPIDSPMAPDGKIVASEEDGIINIALRWLLVEIGCSDKIIEEIERLYNAYIFLHGERIFR